MTSNETFAVAAGWRGKLWAFLRIVGFIALFAVLNIGINEGLHRGLPANAPQGAGLFVATLLVMAATLLITFIMAKVARRPFGAYGLGGTHRVRNFVIGAIGGLALLAALLALQMQLGVYSFGQMAADPSEAAMYGAIYVALFVAVAINEEALFRGYVLVELARVVSFWPAALIMAALFGLLHYGAEQGAEGVIGGAQAGLFALVVAIAFYKTGSLWLPIGLHFGWDYAESYIFGVSDSGHAAVGSLLRGDPHGPAILTGGTVGPEGTPLASIFVLAMLAFVFAVREREADAGRPSPA